MAYTVEKGDTIYVPLYPPEGGPLAGFQCRAVPNCKAVTKTKRGMLQHLGVCHGVRLQHDLSFMDEKREREAGSPPQQ